MKQVLSLAHSPQYRMIWCSRWSLPSSALQIVHPGGGCCMASLSHGIKQNCSASQDTSPTGVPYQLCITEGQKMGLDNLDPFYVCLDWTLGLSSYWVFVPGGWLGNYTLPSCALHVQYYSCPTFSNITYSLVPRPSMCWRLGYKANIV